MKPKDTADAATALREAGISRLWPTRSFDAARRCLTLAPSANEVTYEELVTLYGLFKPDTMRVEPGNNRTIVVRLTWAF